MKTITLGTAPTFFTAVRQKTNDHCLVACIASALLDEGYDKLQELIVDGFPSGLGKDSPDKSGVPKQFTDVEAVLKGSVRWPRRHGSLNLAVSVKRELMAAHDAKNFLMSSRDMARWILIETIRQAMHCVRLCEIRDDGVTIMEPMDGNFYPWTWPQFENEYRALVLLRWQ
jgi:hypothetical protein